MLRHVAVASLLLSAVGCGSDVPFEYLRVQGRLTYEDGSVIPASGIRLQFVPVDAQPVDGAYPRPASEDVDAQGNFKNVTSYKYGDGLIPGKHKVAIFYANDKDGKLLVPKEFTHAGTTSLVVDTADAPFEMKVPKP